MLYDAEKILKQAEILAQKVYPTQCKWTPEAHMLAVQNALNAMDLERRGYEGVI